jgi:hypothetical protein
MVVQVANGCGWGRYRGPGGGACHRFGRGPYPGGYYGPYRRPYWAYGGRDPDLGTAAATAGIGSGRGLSSAGARPVPGRILRPLSILIGRSRPWGRRPSRQKLCRKRRRSGAFVTSPSRRRSVVSEPSLRRRRLLAWSRKTFLTDPGPGRNGKESSDSDRCAKDPARRQR